ncbi:hypothetical protein H257_18676 [Aphanomyces astaci]|uniref:Uncharacterized protein n=2 Tax=Aphanomyces astaci TaxID=112090 RepID=W4FCI8_APHAT|nr:hypothetical protein H257_18676 [Aphanomyces astaci]ETV64443.1 hypothetical protein H257_18676 [Aphanomyces astaci]|eukprot:XP_009846074.1 hypothetical protein H257_18676 [Aphanomyces astaci]
MQHMAGVKGARALAKAKPPIRPEWSDCNNSDPSEQKLSESELAARKVQRHSKHLDEAKTDLYFKATADKLDERRRLLGRLEDKMRTELDEGRVRAEETMRKQAQLNKLYENIEIDLQRNVTKARELEELELGLRDREAQVAQLQLQALEWQNQSELNKKVEVQLNQRQAELEFKEKEVSLLGERLAMQELHLKTVQRQLDQLEREIDGERVRMGRLHTDETRAWRAQQQIEALELERARDQFQMEQQISTERLQQAELQIRKAETQLASDQAAITGQLSALQNKTMALQQREFELNLLHEDILGRESRLLGIRDDWQRAQDEQAKAWATTQAEFKAREWRLQIFAADAEAQVEITAKKQHKLDAKLLEMERALGAGVIL